MSIARPHNTRASAYLAAEPEMYNQLAAPMLKIFVRYYRKKRSNFCRSWWRKAQYPIYQTVIATGELNAHILDVCRKEKLI